MARRLFAMQVSASGGQLNFSSPASRVGSFEDEQEKKEKSKKESARISWPQKIVS